MHGRESVLQLVRDKMHVMYQPRAKGKRCGMEKIWRTQSRTNASFQVGNTRAVAGRKWQQLQSKFVQQDFLFTHRQLLSYMRADRHFTVFLHVHKDDELRLYYKEAQVDPPSENADKS